MMMNPRPTPRPALVTFTGRRGEFSFLCTFRGALLVI